MPYLPRTARSKYLAALSLAAVITCSLPVRAATQDSTWTGSTSTNWNDATNWSPTNAYPNNGNTGISDFDVTIATGANQPTLTANATIDSLTLNTGTILTLNPAVVLNINGPTVTNNGTIIIDTLDSNADLNFTANTTISGTGTITLNDYNPNARFTASAGVTVTSGAGQTINGVGEVDAALINNGIVNANSSGEALVLQTSTMTNTNLFEASNSGNLAISGITVTQTSTGVISNNGGTVSIANSTISGGTLANGTINVTNSTFANTTIAAAATVVVTSGSTLNYSSANLVNNGLIQVDTYSSNADLNFTTNTTLSGTGAIYLDDYNPYARLTTSAGATLIVASGQTVYGLGEIDASLVNNGTINANSTAGNGFLVLQTNNMTNNNLMEATNNATLSISGITLTQSAAGVIANNGGTVQIDGATISGGTLSNGTFSVISNSTFSNLSIAAAATVVLQPAVVLNYTSPTLTNNGLIQIDTLGGNADLNFTVNTSLAGTGSIFINDYSPNALLTTSPGATLTVGASQTIYGVGEIDAALINNGVINANATVGTFTLFLQTNNMTNNNVIKATGTGILTISGITLTQGANGTLSNLGAGANISNATISGGAITTGLFAITSNSTFSSVSISANTTIQLQSGVILNYTGATLTNSGLIQIDTYGSNAALNFTGNTTIAGAGSIFLDDYNPYARITASANATVTFGSSQTIYGVGEIDAPFTNNGTILANGTFGNHYLVINGAANNANLIRATASGTVSFANTSLLPDGSLGNGTIQVDANSAALFTGLTSYTNAGTISLTDPTASFTGLTSLINAGTISLVTGSSISFTGSVTGTTLGAVSGNGTLVAGSLFGKLAIQGGIVRVAPDGTDIGTSKLTSLSLAGTVTAPTSTLDITNNKLIIEDAVTHAATLAALQNEAFYGRTHATGITSSDLPANTVIAVADNSTFATSFTIFGGQFVDANSILVAPELLGDADFSGAVDLNDLNIVLNHLGTTNSNWTAGNFDGATTIDLNDLNDVLNNLGTSYTAPSFSSQNSAFSIPAAPEPTSLSLLAILTPVILRRRRHSF